MYLLSCSGRSVLCSAQADLSQLSCPDKSCPGCPHLAVLKPLSCPGHVSITLSGCPVPAVLAVRDFNLAKICMSHNPLSPTPFLGCSHKYGRWNNKNAFIRFSVILSEKRQFNCLLMYGSNHLKTPSHQIRVAWKWYQWKVLAGA